MILFTAVDNRVTAFNNSANLINVAVSRAKNRFVLISADFAETPDSNLASLVRYILYLDPQARRIAKSKYRSVFDTLFVQRVDGVKRLPGESPAEALFRKMLTKVLGGEEFRHLAFVREYPLLMLPKDFSGFTQAERQFMEHNARLDFLVYDKIDKHPVAAIEVDGSTHGTDVQKRRDGLKNAILEKLGLPLKRFATRNSLGGEAVALNQLLSLSCIQSGKQRQQSKTESRTVMKMS